MGPSTQFTAVLTERRDSGAGLALVTLTPERARAVSYRAPGQYIQVHASASAYFVLAGEIGAPSWELLVRPNGGASDALISSPEGAVFDVSGPLGDGFPLERAHGRPLAVAVAGSALAVTRPILRERIARREGPATSVYIGVRSVAEVALVHEIVGWVHAGARVVLCLSREELGRGGASDGSHPLSGLRRAHGYVQNVVASDVLEGLIGGLVFAAGPAGMLEELRALAHAHTKRSGGGALEVITNV